MNVARDVLQQQLKRERDDLPWHENHVSITAHDFNAAERQRAAVLKRIADLEAALALLDEDPGA